MYMYIIYIYIYNTHIYILYMVIFVCLDKTCRGGLKNIILFIEVLEGGLKRSRNQHD